MSLESSESLIVDPQDLSCPVCLERYSNHEYQPMILPCGHSICSECLPKLNHCCPSCKSKFKRAAKNLLVSSFLERDSRTKKCSIHNKLQLGFSKKNQKLICDRCILEERTEEITLMEKIEEKVQKMKKQGEAMREKKTEVQSKTQELLGKRKQELYNKVEKLLEDQLEYLCCVDKKLRRVVDTLSLTDQGHFERELSMELLPKYEQETEEMLGKWSKNQQGEEGLAARILEAPSEIQNILSSYAEKGNEIYCNIYEGEKELEKLIEESKQQFRPSIYKK